MRGLFVTGTSTGVGKTVAAAALTLGLDGAYWKPVQCGLEEGGDRHRVAVMTGLPASRLHPEAYRLRLPLSPHLAAAAENLTIAPERLAPPSCNRPLIVEGAGGLLVPLNWRHTMLDLASWLCLPVVLVASTALGTINHTLLSLAQLHQRRLYVAGVLFNGDAAEGLEATIAHFGRTPLLGRIPRLPVLDAAALRQAFAGLDRGRIPA